MIDSPIHSTKDIDFFYTFQSFTGRTLFDEEDVFDRARQMQCNAFISFFARLSWISKLKFLTGLVQRLSTVDSIGLILNTLFPVFGKIQLYTKTMTVTKMPFDRILYDHNRMLIDKMVEEYMSRNLNWYEGLSDKDQVALLIGLLRIAGGAIIRIMYKRLKIAHRNRYSHEIQLLRDQDKCKEDEKTMQHELDKGREISESVFHELTYDPNDPNHNQCLRLRQEWQLKIDKYRKEVEKETAKLNKEKGIKDIHDKKKKGKKGKKDKKGKKGKSKKKKKEEITLDWIQFMPIWIVKKIFSYLDTKTLKRVRKVNDYWNWVINDLFKEWKVQKLLDKTKKRITESLGGGLDLPYNSLKEPQNRISHTEKRMQKLYARGAILEKLRYIRTSPLDRRCLMLESLKDLSKNNAAYYINEVALFPRVTRTNAPLMKKPSYICKDYKIICHESGEVTTSYYSEENATFALSLGSSLLLSGDSEF